MSQKLHCDLCDEILTERSRGGVADLHPLFGSEEGQEPMDLCQVHYNSLKQLINTWKTMETGGHVSPNEWPSRRIKERVYAR